MSKRGGAVLLFGLMLALEGCEDKKGYWVLGDPESPTVYPSAVAYWESEKALLVGSHENGAITVVPLDPTRKPAVWRQPLADHGHRAIRLAVDDARGRLWVLDHGAVYIYDLNNKELIKRVIFLATKTSQASCLPDMALDRQGNAFISDNTRPFIYRIGSGSLEIAQWLADERLSPFPDSGISAMAIGQDGKSLFAVNGFSGEFWRLDLETRSMHRLAIPANALRGACGLVIRNLVKDSDHANGHTFYVAMGFSEGIARLDWKGDDDKGAVSMCDGSFIVRTPTSLTVAGDTIFAAHSRLGDLGEGRSIRGYGRGNPHLHSDPKVAYRISRCGNS